MSNNPLQQHFRRPTLYFRLPSNYKTYDETVVSVPPNGELPVYPMTAIDEVTLRTPDALFNGTAMSEIIRSCIPNILDPWKITNIDFDAIVLAIRAASVDSSMDIESICPSCKNNGTYGINLTGLLADQRDIDYEHTLKIRELEIKFRPLIYAEVNQFNIDQFDLQRFILSVDAIEDEAIKTEKINQAVAKMNDLTVNLVSKTIEYIKTDDVLVSEFEYIKDFMQHCDKKTHEAIKNESTRLREKNELKPLNIKCSACGHNYTQKIVLNNTNFFG